ncbi:MAG: Ig-like domain-containing protein [Phyllobacterium sp.]
MIRNAYAYFGFGAVVAAGVVAAYIGLTPEIPVERPVTPPKATEQPSVQPPAAEAPKPAETPAAVAPSQIKALAPSFDILRVEPKGSIVIAGRAAPNANVDVISGSTVLGSAKAGAEGDFAIVLDEPLKPGDYQLVLRSTAENGTVMTSVETAVVSIPDSEKGQVLALVEKAGTPSRMITTPKPAETPVVSENPSDAPAVAAKPPELAPEPAPAVKAPAALVPARVSVEAVEIEGNTIFVAGAAQAGKRVNVYANDTLLGSAIATPDGRFLVQTEHALTVGDYIIRADMTEPNSNEVIGRAAVPFHREQGENIAAVAPSTPQSAQSQAETPDPEAATAHDANQPRDDTTARPLEKADGSVIIRRGDTLWTISRRVYGKGIRYTTIYLANSDQIKDPDMIWPGQVFSLPEKPNKTMEQGG